MESRRVEIHKIKSIDKNFNLFKNFCIMTNNLYNHANYVVRQEFIKTSKEKELGLRKNANWIRYEELDKILKKDKQYPDYYTLPITACSQQILKQLDSNWKSFFNSIKDWKQHPERYTGRPKLPKYKKKQNPFMLIVPKPYFRIKNNSLVFTKAFNNISFNVRCNQKEYFKDIQQVRFIAKQNYIKVEIVYVLELQEIIKARKSYLGIDVGVDNLVTITTNINVKPIIINGKSLKSINQYFNKKYAYLQERLKRCQDKYWSKRLQRLVDKRENKIKDYLHKTSHFIISYCIQNNIDTIIAGHSNYWKQENKLHKKDKQNFIQIPFDILFKQLEYKSLSNNINFIIQEESYTSKASFIDKDIIPIYQKGVKNEIKFSGRRIKRGLYKCKDKSLLNADVNGSLNILRKAFSNVEIPTDRGLLNNPIKINLSNKQYKEYLQQVA